MAQHGHLDLHTHTQREMSAYVPFWLPLAARVAFLCACVSLSAADLLCAVGASFLHSKLAELAIGAPEGRCRAHLHSNDAWGLRNS